MKDNTPLTRVRQQARFNIFTYVISLIAIVFAIMVLTACSSAEPETPVAEAETTVATVEPTPEPTEDAVPSEWVAALTKAQMYVDTMPFSEQGLYDQLTSEYGEKFSPEAARYALNLVEADWNAEALEAALVYQNDMAMSPEAIRDQLVHQNGNQFTQEQADYAVANLP